MPKALNNETYEHKKTRLIAGFFCRNEAIERGTYQLIR